MIRGILDDRSRVANQRGVDSKLKGDRQGPSVPAARAEYRSNTGPGSAGHRGGCSRPQGSARIQKRPVHVERQDLISRDHHEFPGTPSCVWRSVGDTSRKSHETSQRHPVGRDIIVREDKSRGQGQSAGGHYVCDAVKGTSGVSRRLPRVYSRSVYRQLIPSEGVLKPCSAFAR